MRCNLEMDPENPKSDVEMDSAFDDEGEPALTIGEYLDEVEERELVIYFLHSFVLLLVYVCIYNNNMW